MFCNFCGNITNDYLTLEVIDKELYVLLKGDCPYPDCFKNDIETESYTFLSLKVNKVKDSVFSHIRGNKTRFDLEPDFYDREILIEDMNATYNKKIIKKDIREAVEAVLDIWEATCQM